MTSNKSNYAKYAVRKVVVDEMHAAMVKAISPEAGYTKHQCELLVEAYDKFVLEMIRIGRMR